MTEPLSINPFDAAPADNTLSVDAGQQTAMPPTVPQAQAQAARASFGLTDMTGKSQDDIIGHILQGQEKSFRAEAAAMADYQKRLDQRRVTNRILSTVPDAASLYKDQVAMSKLMGTPAPTDPDRVIEDYYAGKYLRPMWDLSDSWTRGSFMTQAMAEDPQHTQQVMDFSQTVLGYKQYAATRTQQAEEKLKQQSYLGRGVDYLKGMSQIYNEIKLRGWMGSYDLTSLLGTALEQQRRELYSLPRDEFKAKFNAIMDKLENDNPSLAVLFGHAVQGQSGPEMETNNATTLFGVPSDLSVVGGLGKRLVMRNMVRQAAQDAVKADPVWIVDSKGNVYTNTPEEIRAAAATGRGDVRAAARAQIAAGMGFNQEKRAHEQIPSFLMPDAERYRNSPSAAGQEIQNRVAEQTTNSQMNLEKAVNNLQKINRIPAIIARHDIASLLTDMIKNRYSGPNSTVLNVDINNLTWMQASNNYRVPIVQGTHDGEYFKTKRQAISHAELHGMPLSEVEDIPYGGKGNIIKQDGLGWYIRGWVPINETDSIIRDALLDMPGSWSGPSRKAERKGVKTPYLPVLDPLTGEASYRVGDVIRGYINSGPSRLAEFLGVRSPEETLSPVENQMRGIATFGPSHLMEMFQENNALIKAGRTKNLLRVLVNNQNMLDPVTKEHGYFFKDIAEFENHYATLAGGDMPSAKEIQAYFATVNNYEMERSLRTLMMIRNKSRLGFMQYRLWYKEGETEKSFTKKYSDYFDARIIDDLPKTGDPVLVSINNKHRVKRSGSLTNWERKGMEEGKYKVIELWNREERPLHKTYNVIDKNTEPRYILTDSYESTPLDFNKQVPRRGGGHWIFEYNHYMKQPNVYHDPVSGKAIYKGDTTAMPFQMHAVGAGITRHFNEIRKLLKAGDEIGARKYVNDLGVAGLDFDKNILPKFKGSDAIFNLEENFRMVAKDQTTLDLDDSLPQKYGKRWQDSTKNGNISRSSSVEFTGQRDAYDLHTIEDKGSARNPIYSYRPAQLMDPMDAMNRSMTRVLNSFYMDDYKHFAVEHWIRTYQPWLDARESDIMHAPFYYFLNAEFRKGMPDYAKAIAIANRKKIKDFIGTPNTFTNMVHKVTQKLMDDLYEKGVSAKYLPIEKIAMTKNPTQAIRGLVGDLKLGLGSIPAFFMQASAMSNVMAISFRQGPTAVLAAFMHMWTRVNPGIVDEIDKMVSRGGHLRGMLGFQNFLPGQFKEAWNAYKESGMHTVGAEHAMFDNMFANRGVRTLSEAIKFWGRLPFREGAQMVRSAAYYAAYLEHRHANPVGALTRADLAKIGGRAKMLDHDMNRSSASALNSGVMSVPSQFYNYARNLAEMFYGKRLTVGEKARLFAVNSVLWGVPAGGIGLFGIPFGDWSREEAIKQGYIPGNDIGYTTFIDGGMAALTAYITGHGDIQKGTVFHYGKFGVQGWDPINNAVDQDKTFLDFLGGASWSVLKNTWKRSSNLRQDIGSLIHNDGKFEFKLQDFVDVLKEASGVSYPVKLYLAIHTGKMISNNNTPLMNIGTGAAITNFLTGLVPADIADLTAYKGILSSRKAALNEVTFQFKRNLNLGLMARRDGDEKGYVDWLKKASAWLAPFPHERSRIVQEAWGQKATLVESINWQMGHQNVPEDESKTQEERFKQVERLRRKREEK